MTDFLQLLLSGVATGAIYAMAALGFTLLWQAAGTINFAQGEFVMLPAFAMLIGMSMGSAAVGFVHRRRGALDSGARCRVHEMDCGSDARQRRGRRSRGDPGSVNRPQVVCQSRLQRRATSFPEYLRR